MNAKAAITTMTIMIVITIIIEGEALDTNGQSDISLERRKLRRVSQRRGVHGANP